MKKILALMLSLALVTSSLVSVFASETKPYATVTVASEDVTENYNTIMEIIEGAPLSTGQSVYKLTVDFNNLPDLSYGSYDGKSGVRLATFNVGLGVAEGDLSKVVSIFGLASGDEGFGVESTFSRIDCTIEKNEIENSIAIISPTIMKAQDGFPKKSSLNDEDVDGKLSDVCVFYLVVTAPITITSIKSDISCFNLNVLTTDNINTKSANIAVGTPAGKTVGFASTVDYVAGKTGVEFAITTDDSAATTKTKTVKVPFGTVIESKTTGIKMGVNVTGVPSTVSLTSTAALY